MVISVVLVTNLPFLYAQTSEISQLNIEPILDSLNVLVKSWNSGAFLSLAFVIGIAVLCSVTIFMQFVKQVWSKQVTIILGLIIIALTVTKLITSDEGFQSLKTNRVEAQNKIDSLRFCAERYDTAEGDKNKDSIINEIRGLVHGIYDLNSYKTEKSGPDFKSLLSSTDNLTEEDPEYLKWISEIKFCKEYIYFSGIADNSSVNYAREVSMLDANINVINYLTYLFENRVQLKNSTKQAETLPGFIAQSVELDKTDITFDRANGTYKYYTLLKLNKQLIDIDLKLFGLRHGLSIPPQLLDIIKQAEKFKNGYVAWSKQNKSNTVKSESSKVALSLTDKFIKAIKLLEDEAIRESVMLFKEIGNEDPEFYKKWLKLETAYNSLQKKHKQSGENVKDLNNKLVVIQTDNTKLNTMLLKLKEDNKKREQQAHHGKHANIGEQSVEILKSELKEAKELVSKTQEDFKIAKEIAVLAHSKIDAMSLTSDQAFRKNIKKKLLKLKISIKYKNRWDVVVEKKIEHIGVPVSIGGKTIVFASLTSIGLDSDIKPNKFVEYNVSLKNHTVTSIFIKPGEEKIAGLVIDNMRSSFIPLREDVKLSKFMPVLLSVRNDKTYSILDKIRDVDVDYFTFRRDRLAIDEKNRLKFDIKGIMGTSNYAGYIVKGDQIVDLSGDFVGVAYKNNSIVRIDNINDWEFFPINDIKAYKFVTIVKSLDK